MNRYKTWTDSSGDIDHDHLVCSDCSTRSTVVVIDTIDADAHNAAHDMGLHTGRYAAPGRCDADSIRGTGTGVCDAPLDDHGNCPRADRHR